MLRRIIVTVGLSFLLAYTSGYSVANADEGCEAPVGANGDDYTVSDCIESTSAPQPVTDDPDNPPGGSTPEGCFRDNGEPVDCWNDELGWWNPQFQMHCVIDNPPANSPDWDGHRDSQGNPIGNMYDCRIYIPGDRIGHFPYWSDDVASTPPKSGSNPESLVRAAIEELQLHQPVPGVGAYVYPKEEKWGLSWWVGAPMWLWVDKQDDLQWGTHTLSVSEGGITVTADIRSTQATWDVGDGTTPIVCKNAGTPRPWNPKELINKHSPSGCEHAYMHTNELGNVNSRYDVSVTVTWEITWSTTDGQYGYFTMDVPSAEVASIHVGELHVVSVPMPR